MKEEGNGERKSCRGKGRKRRETRRERGRGNGSGPDQVLDEIDAPSSIPSDSVTCEMIAL